MEKRTDYVNTVNNLPKFKVILYVCYLKDVVDIGKVYIGNIKELLEPKIDHLKQKERRTSDLIRVCFEITRKKEH